MFTISWVKENVHVIENDDKIHYKKVTCQEKKKKMPQLSLMHKVLVHRSYITWKLKIPNCSWASARNVSFGFCIQCPLAWHLPSRKYSPDGGIAPFYEFLLCLDYFTWLDFHFTFSCLIVSIKLSGVTARA